MKSFIIRYNKGKAKVEMTTVNDEVLVAIQGDDIEISDGKFTIKQLYEIIQNWQKAEIELSDAYLRIRKLVNAWDTKPGGTDRFAVTEKRIQDILNERNKLYEYIDKLKTLLQGEGVFVPGIGEK
jgi:hypothetical protein